MTQSIIRRILSVLILISAALNGVQAARLYLLSSEARALWAEHQLQVGEAVPELVLLDHAQKAFTAVADRPAKPVLLYWMSPTCTWCMRNEANFRALAASIANQYHVVAVSATAEGLEAFVKNTLPPYTIGGPPDAPSLEAYKFAGTPMTVVISSNRRVQHIWRGAYQGVGGDEIEHLFHVKLPGLLK
jgi:peroxiredoxin